MKIKVIATIMLLVMLILNILPTTNVLAGLAEGQLLIINGKTITETTTIDQINNMFGKPKLETQTAFGGKAYSYYDSSYSYYLFIETNAEGKIMSYGAIGGDFKATRYAQGDIGDNYYWNLSGTVLSDFDTDEVYGILEYNCSSADVENYWKNYKKNESTYLYDLQKHSSIVSKVLSVRNGETFTQTYSDEDIFYINEQLKYNGSDLYEYAKNAGKTKSINLISGRTDRFYEALPNPIDLGSQTEGYIKAENYKYVLYDIKMTDYTTRRCYKQICFIDPSFLEERKSVELTNEEKQKLEAAKKEYKKYQENATAITELYEEEPNYKTLPLSAGKYSKVVLQAVTDYLNVARAGLGIGTLTLNEEIADCAQHKAALVYYMNSNNMSTGHFPTQPAGVSDEFYKKAQSYMNENLFMGTIQSSIDYALNDAYGDAVTCGHRYNLLEPGYTQWGIGSVGTWTYDSQSAHKFAGYSNYSNELVAWPSNGIMPIDMVSRGIGNWTAQFYKNYEVTPETEVTIKCLNTEKTYEITNENKNNSGKLLEITGKYLVTFRDDSITYENGDVFEITIHNVKNSNGNITDYNYRSVFYNFYQSTNTLVTDITLNKQSLNLAVGGSERILATIVPTDASIKLMQFTSNNENVAKVRQDGTITGIKEGKAVITITSGSVTKTVNVTISKALKGDVNYDKKVNLYDALQILKQAILGGNLTNDMLYIMDYNDDGNVNLYDALKFLQQAILG